MTPYEVLEMVRLQLERGSAVPMFLAPSHLKQNAPLGILYVGAIGITPSNVSATTKVMDRPHTMRLRLVFRAQVEGPGTGLRLAMNGSWALTKYLVTPSRVEDLQGDPIANSRFMAKKVVESDLDTLFDHPETAGMATFEETWIINLEIPASLME